MSSTYSGISDNMFGHALFNISSSTNATPIKITTTAPHDLSEFDRVIVTGHATNTNANGLWAVHVVDGSNVQLYFTGSSSGLGTASIGNGVGGATGTIRGVGMLPTVTIPSDGDNVTAASVNVGLEGAGDSVQHAFQNTGKYYIDQQQQRGENATSYQPSLVNWISNTITAGGGWQRVIDSGGIAGEAADFFTGSPYLNVMGGDLIDVTFSTSYVKLTTGGASAGTWFALGYELFDFGASQTNTPVKITGTAQFVNYLDAVNAALDNQPMPLLRARFATPSLPANRSMQQMQIYVIAQPLTNAGGPYAYALAGDRYWHSTLYRPTNRVF